MSTPLYYLLIYRRPGDQWPVIIRHPNLDRARQHVTDLSAASLLWLRLVEKPSGETILEQKDKQWLTNALGIAGPVDVNGSPRSTL